MPDCFRRSKACLVLCGIGTLSSLSSLVFSFIHDQLRVALRYMHVAIMPLSMESCNFDKFYFLCDTKNLSCDILEMLYLYIWD